MSWDDAIAAVSGIAAAMASLVELSKGLGPSRSQKTNEVILDLQARLMTTNGAVLDLETVVIKAGEQSRALEEELRRLRQWNADRERYEIREIEPGVFVYAVKPGLRSEKPEPYLCAQCFEQTQRSYLQFQGYERGLRVLECHACKGRVLHRGEPRAPMNPRVPRPRSRFDDLI